MRYDVRDLPGPPDPGCGEAYVETRLADDHQRGDRVTIRCRCCGRVTEHTVLARLTGLE